MPRRTDDFYCDEVLSGRTQVEKVRETDRVSVLGLAELGLREAAQYALLDNMIGADGAIMSAALGFFAGAALTVFGGVSGYAAMR